MTEDKRNEWKGVAILFIILFVLETLLLIWWVIASNSYLEAETECVYDICEGVDDINYDAYLYESEINMCYCYKAGEIVKQEYIK